MTTENSFNATPEELVGKSDDVLNVTTQSAPAAEAELSAENQNLADTESVAADFTEEDAALDAEKAGLAIGD